MITLAQLATLSDIFENTEAVEKITIRLDHVTRSITVHYDDLDDEWFHELVELAAGTPPAPEEP